MRFYIQNLNIVTTVLPGPFSAGIWRAVALVERQPAKQAIIDFVERATVNSSAAFIPTEDRIATFDNDGM